MFYDKTYYLGAGDKGEDAYRLLHDALDKAGRAGIGRFTFHDREYLAAVRPLDGMLALHTMRFADELVTGRRRSSSTPPSASPSEREIEMAGKLDLVAAARSSSRASARTSTARRCST